ncbi:MAG TPA: TlpA family protein disulfide reductase [candidate division WOR-3 bacterium]|uniref:TlpA family protein disulfide reductase n=1 Tax=candidate division WOR-3 bacterium TaxID=2052148 RepID=A0A7V5LU74_UNCW3|nr:TlpA family protein disulfide reductase [candidate division WOR-3 bacterium]
MNKIKLFTTLIILLFIGIGGAEEKTKAPEFTINTIDGKKISLSNYKGKPVILDFWATWCGPCRMEIPGFVELKKKYGDKIEILGISLDRSEKQVVKFKEAYKINYPVAMATREIVKTYSNIYRIMYIPTTFIIDRNGNVYDIYVGYKPREDFEKTLLKLLNEKED